MLLSTGPHIASTWTNPTRPAVFFWYLFIAAKIPRAAGKKLLKTPQALGLTSKQLSSFFTRCFQDPRLFSLGNQILLEIFLSDITIYRTLALDIMFISDLYMSTWPIKFIERLESFSLFINLSLWPPSTSGKEGGRNKKGRVRQLEGREWLEAQVSLLWASLHHFSPVGSVGQQSREGTCEGMRVRKLTAVGRSNKCSKALFHHTLKGEDNSAYSRCCSEYYTR